jgi:hypothetical protein
LHIGLEVCLLYGHEKHLALSLSRPIEWHAEGKELQQTIGDNGNELREIWDWRMRSVLERK